MKISNKLKTVKLLVLLCVSTIMFTSCSKDDNVVDEHGHEEDGHIEEHDDEHGHE